MMGGLKLTGIKELQKGLSKKSDLSAFRRVVMQNGSELQREAQRLAPVATATLMRSIMLALPDMGLTAIVAAMAEHAPYQEWGTRFMNAHPYLGPAFRKQKVIFERDMNKLVK